MGAEHLLTDNPEAIAFGRSRLAALRALGKTHVTQVYDTPWGQVTVRIVGSAEYIRHEGGGNLFLIFWQPAPGTTETEFNATIALHNKALGPNAWYDRQVYTRGPGRYFIVGTKVPECTKFKLLATFDDVLTPDENATNFKAKQYVFSSVVNNKVVHWRREAVATGTDTSTPDDIDTGSGGTLHHDRLVRETTEIVFGGTVVAAGHRTHASVVDTVNVVGGGTTSSDREEISGVYGRSLTSGWDLYAHPTTEGFRQTLITTNPPSNNTTSNWVMGWKHGKVGELSPPRGADADLVPAPDDFDAVPPVTHSFYPPVHREAIDGGYRRMYLDLRAFGAGEFEARVIQCSQDYLYAAWEDGFIQGRLGSVGGDPIPDPVYFELFGERGVAREGNFPTAERYYTAFFNDVVTVVRGSRADDPGSFSIVTTEFATGRMTVIEKRDLADLLPADVHLLGAIREEITNQPTPKEN